MRPIARTVTAEEMQRLGPILPPGGANPKVSLDKIGETLHSLVVNSDKSNDLIHLLWKRYLADCRRHGVKAFDPVPGTDQAEGKT